jgi:methylated-DNA-[protein]-cysteine S-methyltransferase
MSSFYTYLPSPIGSLLLAADTAGLRQITFPKNGSPASPQPGWIEDSSAFLEPIRQLRAYFAGDLETFNLPLAPQGTPFQQEVWKELCKIPYGETISYGELAKRIGNSKASRSRISQRLQSYSDHHSLPSRDRLERQAYRLWRRLAH